MRRLAIVGLLAACGGGAAAAPDAGPGWSAGPPLPGPLLEPGVVALDGDVWVIGGFDADLEVTTDVWILPAGGDAWQPGPPAPAPLTHMNLAVWNGRLYLLGGLVGRDLVPDARAWVLSADRTSWQPRAPLPAGRERGAAAVIATAGRVVVAGGADATAALGDVLVYDPAADAWTAGPDLPSPRSHPNGALGVSGEALVIGGLATLDATHPLTEVLALGGAAWVPRAPMPTARGGCSAAVVGGVVYCVGGEAGTSVLRAVEAYDPAADTWTELPGLPRGRGGTGGAAWGGVVVAPGGAHKLAWEPTADVDLYDPAAAPRGAWYP